MFTTENERRISQEPRCSRRESAGKTTSRSSHVDNRQAEGNPRKRRLGDMNIGESSISLHAYPAVKPVEVLRAAPRFIIPRARLPLYYLDPQDIFAQSPATRLCSADIPLLRNAITTSNQEKETHGCLLVIVIEGQKCLSVVEHVRNDVYSICAISAWVREEELMKLATAPMPISTFTTTTSNAADHSTWWSAAVLEEPLMSKRHKTIAPSPSHLTSYSPQNPEQVIIESANTESDIGAGSTIINVPAVEQVIVAPTPQPSDCITTLVGQYLDTLYLSKTPLAFFAKGPLARARVLLQSDGTVPGPNQLAELLRPMVLGLPLLDKKYKDKMPLIIKGYVEAQAVAESNNGSKTKKAKSRKLKKCKPSKDGTYSIEEDLVGKWWAAEDESVVDMSSDEALVIREGLAKLRMRETLLQLTLILEVLALEVQTPVENVHSVQIKQESQSEELLQTESKTQAKKSKSRKSVDLQLAMDMIVDRLCIWQSVENDTAARTKAPEAKSEENQHGKMRSSSDQLKDFCVEVAIPFYKSRLPDVVDNLSRKLGLSGWSSEKPASGGERRRPGNVDAPESQRLAARGKNRTAASSMGPPPLIRSATDSLLQAIQREKSSTPQGRVGRGPISRSNSTSNRFAASTGNSANSTTPSARSRREVDLDAMKKFNESKLAKKASMSQELQAAIATLKRPNRGAAVGAYFQAADQQRGVAGQKLEVVVDATPKKGVRTRDVVGTTPQRDSRFAALQRQVSPSPSSYVPSSAVRLSPPVASLPAVVETPSHRPSKHVDDDERLFRTPARPGLGTNRLLFQSSALKSSVGEPAGASLFTPDAEKIQTQTQIRTLAEAEAENEAADAAREEGRFKDDNQDSIYRSLGWEDDDDDQGMKGF